MKPIIQIPCYKEAGTLAIAQDALPRLVPGFDVVEWLIIDVAAPMIPCEWPRRMGWIMLCA